MMTLSIQIEKSFSDYDSYFNRQGLNYEQMCKLF